GDEDREGREDRCAGDGGAAERRIRARSLRGREQESKEQCRQRADQDDDYRLPAESRETEESQPARDQDSTHRAGEADPAGKREAPVGGMPEKRPGDEGAGKEARHPEVSGFHRARLLQTVPSGVERRRSPGGEAGAGPEMTRYSAWSSEWVGTAPIAAAKIFLPGSRATASLWRAVSMSGLRGSARALTEVPTGMTFAASVRRRHSAAIPMAGLRSYGVLGARRSSGIGGSSVIARAIRTTAPARKRNVCGRSEGGTPLTPACRPPASRDATFRRRPASS